MDFPSIPGYTIKELVPEITAYHVGFSIVYRGSKDENEDGVNHSYLITEFNPEFMTTRSENGDLAPINQFAVEYERALEEFRKKCEIYKSLEEHSIAPPIDVIEANHTIYLVKQENKYRDFNSMVGEVRMDFQEAYDLMRPMSQGLIEAQKVGLNFEFTLRDVYFTPYRQLIIDCVFAKEDDSNKIISELAKTYYRLVSGIVYNKADPTKPSLKSLGIPPKMTKTIEEVLKGEASYGSVDDFSKQVRNAMDAEGKKEKPKRLKRIKLEKPKTQVKKNSAIVVIACLALSLLFTGAIAAYYFLLPNLERETSKELTDWERILLETLSLPVEVEFTHRHHALTETQTGGFILNDSILPAGEEIYLRALSDGVKTLTRINANDVPQVLVNNVWPAFINVIGAFVYFTDGLTNYSLHRVRLDGTGHEIILDSPVSWLHSRQNLLFYTNHADMDSIWVYDVIEGTHKPFLRIPAYEMQTFGEELFFINRLDGFRINAVLLNDPNAGIRRVNDVNSDNLNIMSDGSILYRDVETRGARLLQPGFYDSVSFRGIYANFLNLHEDILAFSDAVTSRLMRLDLRTNEILVANQIVTYAAPLRFGAMVIPIGDFSVAQFAVFSEIVREEANIIQEREDEIVDENLGVAEESEESEAEEEYFIDPSTFTELDFLNEGIFEAP